MSTTESDAPRRFASPEIVRALFTASKRAKDESSTITGAFGKRVQDQVELGNLHARAFRMAAMIHRAIEKDEIKGRELLDHLNFYIELLEADVGNKGHVGNLADMANEAAAGEQQEEGGDLNAAPTGEGGVPLGDALKQFEATAEIKKRRPAVRKGLDLPADGSAAVTAEAAPPPPPADDEDADLRPAMLRRKEAEREEAAGTFAQVH